jgi:hypothetical protein
MLDEENCVFSGSWKEISDIKNNNSFFCKE